jgi:hypothetical protein
VAGVSVVAGDVPTSPAFFEGAGVVGEEAAGVADGFSGGIGEDGADDEGWPLSGEGAGVAGEAGFVAVELEFTGIGAGVEAVEGESEGGVGGRGFDEAAGDPAEVEVIGEEECAGVFGGDAAALEAGFGEQQDLGIGGDVEGMEAVFEGVFVCGTEQGESFVVDGMLEGFDGVGCRGLGVADWGQFVFGYALGGGREGQGGQEDEEQADSRGAVVFGESGRSG